MSTISHQIYTEDAPMRLSFWFLCFCTLLHAKPLDVAIKGRNAILLNADTGAVLFEKHAHIPAFPGSTTKVATALFILDEKNPDLSGVATVSAECLKLKTVNKILEAPSHWLEVDGTRMGLVRGEMLSLDALFHGLLMVSGNDAANVLAETVSGTIPNFMEEMNLYIKNLGCRNTQFLNPHGLHHPEHYTTAYDLALIMKRALQVPKFRELTTKLTYEKPKTNKQPKVEIKQGNPLIRPGKGHYPKAIAVKTGNHSAAGKCIAAAAIHEGRTLIAVVLGCEDRTSRDEDAIRLFETAFAEKKETKRCVGPDTIFTKEIAESQNLLRAALSREIAIEYFPSEDPKAKAFLNWDLPSLPIQKGQKVGEVRIVTSEGTLLKKGDLLALQEVKGTFFFIVREKLRKFFSLSH